MPAPPAPWTVALQASLATGFPRQEYWSGLPSPPRGDLPSPGIEPASPVSPSLAGRFFTPDPPEKPYKNVQRILKGYLRAEDKLCRVPHPQIWGLGLTAAHWAVDRSAGWPRQSWFTVARQETTPWGTAEPRLLGRCTQRVRMPQVHKACSACCPCRAWRATGISPLGRRAKAGEQTRGVGAPGDAHCPCLGAWGRVIQGRDKQGWGGRCTELGNCHACQGLEHAVSSTAGPPQSGHQAWPRFARLLSVRSWYVVGEDHLIS